MGNCMVWMKQMRPKLRLPAKARETRETRCLMQACSVRVRPPAWRTGVGYEGGCVEGICAARFATLMRIIGSEITCDREGV